MDQSIEVLHVDDEPDFADAVASFLDIHEDDFTVQTAQSATEGLSILERSEIDCIVSDYEMPGADGIEFLESVREIDSDIPFVLFTGKGSEEIASKAISAGVSDYLQKETGTDQYLVLANRIRNLVKQNRAETKLGRRVDQQEAVAALGEEAAAGNSVESLVHSAVEKVSATLDFTGVGIYEQQADEGELGLRAAAGEYEGVVGETTITDQPDTPEYPSQSTEPVTVDRFATDDRFRGSALSSEASGCGLSVPIGEGPNSWGVLVAYARDERAVSEYELAFVESVASLLAPVIDRQQDEQSGRNHREKLQTREQALRDTYEIIADPNRTFEEKVPPLLETVSDVLGTEYATLSQVDGDTYHFESVVTPDSSVVDAGDTVPVTETNCREVIETRELLALEDVESQAPNLADADWVNSYLGTPVVVDDAVYGTFCFYDETARKTAFTEWEIAFVELFGNWLGNQLERNRIETELRQEHALLEGILETSPVGISVIDSDGRITFINEHAEQILGRSRDTLDEFTSDDTRWDLVTEHGDSFENTQTPFEAVVANEGPIFDQIIGLRRPDGTRVWLSVNGAPQWDDDGDLERAVFAFEDITDKRELEAELEEIFGRVDEAFYALDDEFRFTHVNDRAEELLQASADELLGKTLWEEYPEATEIDEVWDAFHTAMELQEPQSYELYYEPLEFWVEATVYPSETGVSVYFRDTTERKEREAEREEMLHDLWESEQRLQLALEAGGMGTWELDLESLTFPVRSPQFDRIFGYEEPLSEWEFETFIDHVHPDDRADVTEQFEEAHETGVWEFECRITRTDGTERVIAVKSEFSIDDEGAATRAIGVIEDITERTERERELRDAKTQLESATEAAEIGTWEWRVQEERMVMGASFARMFGVDPEDAREGVPPETFLDGIHEADKERVLATIDDALESCGEYEAEYRLRTADGDLRWVVARGTVDCNDAGRPISFPGAITDITERKRAETELERQNERLNEFANVISHDLRNPLNVIELSLSSARRECDSDHLDAIEDARDRMETLIEDLLALARHGETVRDSEQVDLATLIDESWGTVETADATLIGECDFLVQADRSRLQQVFENLFRNAVEHAGEDVTIRVSELDDGFAIEDDGSGIPEPIRDELFDAGRTTSENGTGFGLTIVEQIVDAHDWEIQVADGADGGARFEITGVEFVYE